MPRKPRNSALIDDDDPVVAEVRKARAALMKEAGGTLKGLLDLVYGKNRNGKAARPKTRTPRTTKRPAPRA